MNSNGSLHFQRERELKEYLLKIIDECHTPIEFHNKILKLLKNGIYVRHFKYDAIDLYELI